MTQTPTITRVSLEPFYPACGGGLEMQKEVRAVHKGDKLLAFIVLCYECGETWLPAQVAWREREKEEE